MLAHECHLAFESANKFKLVGGSVVDEKPCCLVLGKVLWFVSLLALSLWWQGSCLYWAMEARSPRGPSQTKSAIGAVPIRVSRKLILQSCAIWSKSFSLGLGPCWLFPKYWGWEVSVCNKHTAEDWLTDCWEVFVNFGNKSWAPSKNGGKFQRVPKSSKRKKIGSAIL